MVTVASSWFKLLRNIFVRGIIEKIFLWLGWDGVRLTAKYTAHALIKVLLI